MTVNSLKYTTNSGNETSWLGRRLGALLKDGDLVALIGELGSGKTWFTKGLAFGLGVDPGTIVTSPSFSLVNEYAGRSILYHMDLYRLEDLSAVFSAGLEEYIHQGDVVVMEWADRWPEILPDKRIEVRIRIIGDEQREIRISGDHPRAREIIVAMGQEEVV